MPEALKSIPGRRAYLNLLKAHERVFTEFSELFREHGLTHTQFNVLRILITSDPEGVSCQQISEELLNRVPDVTRLIDRMKKAGLVARRRSDTDRRVVLVQLTEKGREQCERLYGPVMALHRKQFAHVPKRVMDSLNESLEAFLQS